MEIKPHTFPHESDSLLQHPHRQSKQRDKVNGISQILLAFIPIVSLGLCLYLGHIGRINSLHFLESSINIIQHNNKYIYPGRVFYDTQGEPINAHGGGFLHYNNTYYWYGEIKQGKTYLPEANANWGGTRVDFVGISCYASTDILNWRKCNTFNVLPAVNDDPSHDLHWSKVGERPEVVYNAKTGKFVMWLHIDTMDYQLARCGVAISDGPEGPFTYHGSFRPGPEEGQMARDLALFVDDDSKAYIFTSSEDNAVMHVSELTDDYLSTNGPYERIFIGEYVEAPTLFKKDGMYYFIGSGCTAWNPNAAKSAVAESITGPWKLTGNPCRGENSNTTFRSQSTYIIPVSNGNGASYIFAADRWNMNNLSDSRYVWLPISFDKTNEVEIWWQDHWRPGHFNDVINRQKKDYF